MRQLCHSARILFWSTVYVSQKRKPYVNLIYAVFYKVLGAWGSVVVKTLRYSSDGPGIDSRWCHWIFQ